MASTPPVPVKLADGPPQRPFLQLVIFTIVTIGVLGGTAVFMEDFALGLLLWFICLFIGFASGIFTFRVLVISVGLMYWNLILILARILHKVLSQCWNCCPCRGWSSDDDDEDEGDEDNDNNNDDKPPADVPSAIAEKPSQPLLTEADIENAKKQTALKWAKVEARIALDRMQRRKEARLFMKEDYHDAQKRDYDLVSQNIDWKAFTGTEDERLKQVVDSTLRQVLDSGGVRQLKTGISSAVALGVGIATPRQKVVILPQNSTEKPPHLVAVLRAHLTPHDTQMAKHPSIKPILTCLEELKVDVSAFTIDDTKTAMPLAVPAMPAVAEVNAPKPKASLEAISDNEEEHIEEQKKPSEHRSRKKTTRSA